jgi:hypothetical protein
VGTGSREENATNQKSKVFHRFRETVKDFRERPIIVNWRSTAHIYRFFACAKLVLSGHVVGGHDAFRIFPHGISLRLAAGAIPAFARSGAGSG